MRIVADGKINIRWLPGLYRKLEAMSREEILEAQQQLRSSLSPQLLEFLQSRRRPEEQKSAQTAHTPAGDSATTSEPTRLSGGVTADSVGEVTAMETSSREAEQSASSLRPVASKSVSSSSEVLRTARAPPDLLNRYPHMNRDEPEKREWMTDVPETEVSGRRKGGYTARFGFDGRLLDPSLKARMFSFQS
jgi:hypothetical protein